MKPGDKVIASFDMTITSIVHQDDHPERSFVCGDVSLDLWDTKIDKMKVAYVSGVPISKVIDASNLLSQ